MVCKDTILEESKNDGADEAYSNLSLVGFAALSSPNCLDMPSPVYFCTIVDRNPIKYFTQSVLILDFYQRCCPRSYSLYQSKLRRIQATAPPINYSHREGRARQQRTTEIGQGARDLEA
jgi:hypothetical protein